MFIEIIGFKKKKMRNSLSQMKIIVQREAEEASYLKSQFVSISHELRTPLYGVVGYNKFVIG
jgi:K+-sensing histidine kinase KdpD